jgi:ferredoxin-type protein NapH
MKRINAANLRAIVIVVLAAVITFGYIAKLDIGNLSALGVGVIAAICPLGALETQLASLTFIPRALIAVLIAVALIVVFGRAFCSWACPVPLLQRWFPGYKRKKELLDDDSALGGVADVDVDAGVNAGARVKAEASADVGAAAGVEAGMEAGMEAAASVEAAADVAVDTNTTCTEETKEASAVNLCGKLHNVRLDSRHIVLGGSLLSAAVFGFPVFCLVCPVGLTFASLLVIYRLFGFGEVTWTAIVFPLILVLELVVFRKWCSKICPLGALLSLVAGANRLFRPHIDDSKCLATKGVRCSLCAKACSRENIDLRHPTVSQGALSDCTKCGDCAEACPSKAISFPLFPRGSVEGSKPLVDKNKAAS